MTILTKTQIIGLFENGDVPSGTDFANWILSCITAAETSAQSMTGDLNIAGTLNAYIVSAGTISIGNISVDTISASGANFTRVSATTGIVANLTSTNLTAVSAAFTNIRYSGSLGGTSDRRLKTHIVPLGDVLEKLRRLNPVSFQKTATPGRTEFGLIAQELEMVFPELVSGEMPMLVDYLGLIGILVRAAQQLDEKTRNLA